MHVVAGTGPKGGSKTWFDAVGTTFAGIDKKKSGKKTFA